MWVYVQIPAKTETYLLKELNDSGQQGWELVAITQTKDRKGELVWMAFLKRPFVPQVGAPQQKAAAAEPEPEPEPSREEHRVEPAESGEGFDFDVDDVHFQGEKS
jgi:hypothetical protein